MSTPGEPLALPVIRAKSEDGRLLVREGLSVCFFVRQSHAEVAPHVFRAIQILRSIFGEGALKYYVDDEGQTLRLAESDWPAIMANFHTQGNFTLKTMDNSAGASGYALEYGGYDLKSSTFAAWPTATSYLIAQLPAERLEADRVEALRHQLIALANHMPGAYGYASLAFNYGAGADEPAAFKSIRRRCFDLPGLDVHRSAASSLDMNGCVRGAYWINFLPSPIVSALGGLDQIRREMALAHAQVTSTRDGGVTVMLGQSPAVAGVALAPYRLLAHLLEPFLHKSRFPFPAFTVAETLQWEQRYLDI